MLSSRTTTLGPPPERDPLYSHRLNLHALLLFLISTASHTYWNPTPPAVPTALGYLPLHNLQFSKSQTHAHTTLPVRSRERKIKVKSYRALYLCRNPCSNPRTCQYSLTAFY
ncbi:hypothetical protein TRVL_01075 [Trypanosoma vivax]|nr:hypothetical protein TRVL_01075 [Trypanosoma vivax]